VLLGALLLGRHLRGQARAASALTGWVIAVAAKIYPLLWIALLPFLKRWRLAIALGVACILLFGIVALLERDADRDYWFDYLLEQQHEFTGDVLVDDQSLSARIELLGRTNRVELHGLDVSAREEVVWSPPWEIPGRTLRIVSLVIIIGLGAVVLRTWLVADKDRFGEGLLYLVVLFSLLPIPHMERYNHVALLPAMAWLWRRGPKYRFLTVLAYCLAGLSRLNHLWAAIFHWPLGPLATGTCMYAVLILGVGIVHVVLRDRL
jgi:alpha-1,2-mannosyltransferase